MTSFQAQNPLTSEFEPARYGVGYGGQGAWFNKHFVTIEEAEAFFASEVKKDIAAFSGGEYQTDDTCPTTLVKRWSIVNIKKNGTPGKMRQTVQIYRIA
jgi:hypothetical protein